MEYLVFLLIGVLLTLVFTKKSIKIEVHHIHEDINPVQAKIDLAELEQTMLKEDPETDAKYDDLAQVAQTVSDIGDIMGGSDR